MKLTSLLRHTLFTKAISGKLDYYSQFHPSALSIQHFVDFAETSLRLKALPCSLEVSNKHVSEIILARAEDVPAHAEEGHLLLAEGRDGDQKSSFLFLRKELLVRLAGIMKEISLLPQELLHMPSARLVREWYQQSFTELLQYEKEPVEDKTVHKFTDDLKNILTRHAHVVETMAEGLMELKFSHGIDVTAERNLQYFLDRFYINRISIRMLINQHTLIFGDCVPDSPRHIGCIDPATDVVALIEDAYENAKFLCDRYYLSSPNLKVECKNVADATDRITLVYVPSHLYHIMFELLKNAMRAVVEQNGPDGDLPDLKVFVIKGKEDLSIKVCDRGGGVPRNVVDQLFNYMYTSAPPPPRDGDQAPLAGYGYGLPLSRLYARYFHGDMFLVSMEGYGTDACLYLRALPVDASELLPVYSSASRRMYTMGPQVADWSQPSNANGIASMQSFRAYSTMMPRRYSTIAHNKRNGGSVSSIKDQSCEGGNPEPW